MNFEIGNLGLIKNATVNVSDFTIICGKNNTGKSYLTHSFYGALDFVRGIDWLTIEDAAMKELCDTGTCSIDIMAVVRSAVKPLSAVYNEALINVMPKFLGATKNVCKKGFYVNLQILQQTVDKIDATVSNIEYEFPVRFHEGYSLIVKKERKSSLLTIRYVPGETRFNVQSGVSLKMPASIVANAQWVVSVLVRTRLPRPFIIGSERTGVSVFRNEFNFFRAIAFDKGIVADNVNQLRERLMMRDYPIAIKKDMEFSLQLQSAVKEPGFLSKKEAFVSAFKEIVGGTYSVDTDTGLVSFNPNGSGDKLSITESSSSVRSLCELYFYAMYIARRGDVLILDEPEMNLHPESQRKLARLLAMLPKYNIRVFVTTHSDYIIREVNALVRLAQMDEPSQGLVLKKYGYDKMSLLDRMRVNIYVVNNGVVDKVDFDESVRGFMVPSFDATIESFNQMYSLIQELD